MNKKRLLLHICCAPDATIPWRALLSEEYDVHGFFYGNNIHPEDEYKKRLGAVQMLSSDINGEFTVPCYTPEEWLNFVRGLEDEPEGAARCAKCFEAQFEAAAEYASANGFTHLCTTLTISPHKNVKLINDLGQRIAEKYGLIWLEKVWRKGNGFKKSVEESRRLGLYRQNYCGCIFSKQESEKFRAEHTNTVH